MPPLPPKMKGQRAAGNAGAVGLVIDRELCCQFRHSPALLSVDGNLTCAKDLAVFTLCRFRRLTPRVRLVVASEGSFRLDLWSEAVSAANSPVRVGRHLLHKVPLKRVKRASRSKADRCVGTQ